MSLNSTARWSAQRSVPISSSVGSARHVKAFRDDFISRFVDNNRVQGIIELGLGEGCFADRAGSARYTGVDVCEQAVSSKRADFSARPELQFIMADELVYQGRADLTLSIDTVYNLVEDDVFEDYMWKLFTFSRRYVVIYSSDRERPGGEYIRHRAFTKFAAQRLPEWALAAKIPNVYPYRKDQPEETSWSDFYIYRMGQAPCTLSVPVAEIEE